MMMEVEYEEQARPAGGLENCGQWGHLHSTGRYSKQMPIGVKYYGSTQERERLFKFHILKHSLSHHRL